MVHLRTDINPKCVRKYARIYTDCDLISKVTHTHIHTNTHMTCLGVCHYITRETHWPLYLQVCVSQYSLMFVPECPECGQGSDEVRREPQCPSWSDPTLTQTIQNVWQPRHNLVCIDIYNLMLSRYLLPFPPSHDSADFFIKRIIVWHLARADDITHLASAAITERPRSFK